MGDWKGKVVTRRQRDAVEDAICKIVVAGGDGFPREGSGTLVEVAGHVGILTSNVLVPDLAAAMDSVIVFHVTGIGEVTVAPSRDSMVLSSPSTDLNYTLIELKGCPAGLIPVPLRRGKDCGVQPGDSVQLMQRRGGEREVCVGKVASVTCPTVFYSAQANGVAEGGVVFQGFDAVALHGGANFGARVTATTGSRLMEALSCAPQSTHKQGALSKGILVSAIFDDLQARMRALKRGDAGIAETSARGDPAPGNSPRVENWAGAGGVASFGGGLSAQLSGGVFSCVGRPKQKAQGGKSQPEAREAQDPAAGSGSGNLSVHENGPIERPGGQDGVQKPATPPPPPTAQQQISSVPQKAKFGVGLVLQSWKPKGLTHALNVVSGTHQRVRVERVVAGEPADCARPRIAPGDLLIAVDGVKVTSIDQAGGLLGGEEKEVTLVFGRNGYEFHVVLMRAPPSGGQAPELKPNRGVQNGRDWTATVMGEVLEQEEGNGHAERHAAVSYPPPAAPVLPAGFRGKNEPDAGVWDSIKGIAAIAVGGKGAQRRSKFVSTEDAIALFRVVTAPKLHGVIAKQGASSTELSLELLDKARIGDTSSVRVLLARGADPNFACRDQGWAGATPLIQAASAGSITTIAALIKAGAQIDVSDDMSWTPLHRAAGGGHSAAVGGLLEAGARLSLVDCAGKTPAQLAASMGHPSVFSALEATPPSYKDLQKHAAALREQMERQDDSVVSSSDAVEEEEAGRRRLEGRGKEDGEGGGGGLEGGGVQNVGFQ